MVDHDKLRKEYFALYSEYNKSLRAWFVAFGVGLPVVYITSKEARDYLSSLEGHNIVIVCFIIAMCLQIIIAFLNKYISWCGYRNEGDIVNKKETGDFILWVRSWENAIWIDFVFDALALAFFGISIFVLLFGQIKGTV